MSEGHDRAFQPVASRCYQAESLYTGNEKCEEIEKDLAPATSNGAEVPRNLATLVLVVPGIEFSSSSSFIIGYSIGLLAL